MAAGLSVSKNCRNTIAADSTSLRSRVDFAVPASPSKVDTINVPVASGSMSRRTVPKFLTALQACCDPFSPEIEERQERPAEPFIVVGELLGEVVERATAGHLLRRGSGHDLLAGIDERADRVIRPLQRCEPPVGDPALDDLVDHRMSESCLAPEVVVERPLGQAGLGEDAVNAGAAVAVLVYLLERAFEEPGAGGVGVLRSLLLDRGGLGISPIHTDQYACILGRCQARLRATAAVARLLLDVPVVVKVRKSQTPPRSGSFQAVRGVSVDDCASASVSSSGTSNTAAIDARIDFCNTLM